MNQFIAPAIMPLVLIATLLATVDWREGAQVLILFVAIIGMVASTLVLIRSRGPHSWRAVAAHSAITDLSTSIRADQSRLETLNAAGEHPNRQSASTSSRRWFGRLP